jgi:hypothetical protein
MSRRHAGFVDLEKEAIIGSSSRRWLSTVMVSCFPSGRLEGSSGGREAPRLGSHQYRRAAVDWPSWFCKEKHSIVSINTATSKSYGITLLCFLNAVVSSSDPGDAVTSDDDDENCDWFVTHIHQRQSSKTWGL